MSESKKIEPIWIESLMTRQEWKERCRTFPSTSNISEPVPLFSGPYYWRKGMGAFLPKDEVEIIIKRLDEWHKMVKKNEKVTDNQSLSPSGV